MSEETEALAAGPGGEIGDRIIGAAFKAFMEKGYPGVSMLEIATRARVSKRDLYARFSSKQAVLVACIQSRVVRMRVPPELPIPRDRTALACSLTGFGAAVVTEVSDPDVVAMFQFAVAEVKRSPEVAQALESKGREATRLAFAGLIAEAQAAKLLGEGEAVEMADQYLGLLWEGLLVGLVMGVAARPTADQIQRRAGRATAAFLSLYPEPR